MRKRFIIIYFVVFLIVGYATVSSTLYSFGNLLFGYDNEDFDVYFSFASFLESTESKVEILDKNHFIFKPLISEDDKVLTVNYEIVNASHEYDAEVEVLCVPENHTFTTFSNELVNSFILARDITEGSVTISLNPEYTGNEDIDEEYLCTLSSKAMSRTSIDNSSIDRFIEIDGKKTNIKEWRTIDLVHTNTTDTVYARSDDNYLYLYIENNENIDIQNFRLYISTLDSPSVQIFNYLVENTRVYKYTSNGIATDEVGNLLPHLGLAKMMVDDGVEYAVPLSLLNVNSIEEIKSLKLRYANSSWNVQKEYDVYLKRDEIIVDGNKTYLSEYSKEEIIYQDDTSIIYSRILGDYIYFYVVTNNIMGDDLKNSSIYVGSYSDNVTKNSSTGFMVWYESALLSCNDISCNNSTITKGSPMRAISDGLEFKIPLDVLDMKTMNDLSVVKILYRNSSWQEVKSITVNIDKKIYKEDLVDKTYILAHKPDNYNNFNVYVAGLMKWPGNKMYKYLDEEDTYVYILPDDFTESYVVFSDSGNNQYPPMNQNLFYLENNKSRIWDSTYYGILSWNYVDKNNESNKTEVDISLIVPSGKVDNGYYYLYDETGSLDKLNTWPGISLSKNDKWTGTTDVVKDYNRVRLIFNNGSNWQYPSNEGIYLKPGCSVTFDGTSVYVKD